MFMVLKTYVHGTMNINYYVIIILFSCLNGKRLESRCFQFQSGCLIDTKHDVHVLHGLTYGTF